MSRRRTLQQRLQGLAIACGALLASVPGIAAAEVTASVDRASIDVNESFNLTITATDMVPARPDISPLEADFDVLGQSSSRNAQIVNGQVTQQLSWTYSLMPKSEGELSIPPLLVGSEVTQELRISVAGVDKTDLGGADVIVTAELDRPETWVQAQAIYTIKILTAVTPRQPGLEEPEIEGGEILMQQLGDDSLYESLIDGRNYGVRERRYALFPQQSGEYRIGAVRYSARLWERGRLSSRRIFSSEGVTLKVLPIPPPPPAYPDAQWLPAEKVQLEDRWNPEDRTVAAGEPVTRTLRLSAAGLLANQLPRIPVPVSDGLRVYPDEPELETASSAAGVQGFRTERYALIAAASGSYQMPEIRLPWWNVTTGAWEFASVPAILLPVGEPAALVDVAPAISPAAELDEPQSTPGGERWRLLSAVLATAWIATLALWRWSVRAQRLPGAAPKLADVPGYRKGRRLVREARAAARNNEARHTAAKLLKWAAVRWPDDTPATLGDVAQRIPEPAAGALRELHKAMYGPVGGDWNGARLADALSVLTDLPARKETSSVEVLEPLTPA